MDFKLGVRVYVSKEILNTSPHCPHGPTLLFERNAKNGKGRFYACSACRNRQDCRFFLWEEEAARKMASGALPSPTRPTGQEEFYTGSGDNYDTNGSTQSLNRLKNISKLSKQESRYCQTCNVLILPEEGDAHLGHDIIVVGNEQLNVPSTFLKPLVNDRKEAQYLFANRTVEFLVSTLQNLNAVSVLCIGCPRIHEYFLSNEVNMTSLLMDLDNRHQQMYSPSQFCYYNMFNHHFLNGPNAKEVYLQFLKAAKKRGGLALIVDPPFGGMVEPLALTVQRIREEWLSCSVDDAGEALEMQVLWVFPYFMEKKMLQFLPRFSMLDYQVDYENHPLYKNRNAGRRQSPVRIFTNVAANRIPLPEAEGYKFCKECDRYVSSENQHCIFCKTCPTKSGQTYVHCSICEYCVKPGRTHCDTCKRCEIPNHVCNSSGGKEGCHVCGDLSHKRADCSYVQDSRSKRKGNWSSFRKRVKRQR